MRPRAAVVAVVAVVAIWAIWAPSRAVAGPPDVPGDAVVIAVASPDEIAAQLAAIGKLSAVHAMSIGFARQAARAELGWDPGDPAAWKAQGFDPAGRVWLSLSVGDGPARYEALTRARRWTPSTGASTPATFWHVRLIAETTDLARATAAVRRVTSGLKGVELFVSARKSQLVVDAVRPMFFGAGAPVSRASMRARAAVHRGAGVDRAVALLAAPGLRGWIRSTALIDIGRAMQREFHIELLRDGQGGGAGPWTPNPRCAELADLAGRGLFSGLAFGLRPLATGLAIDLRALPRRGQAIAPAFPTTGPVGLAAHRRRGVRGALEVRLRSLTGLRTLPRPPVFSSFTDALAHIRGCESHYGWTARLFGWPQLIGLFADEIAGLGPRGEAILKGLGAVAAGVTRFNREPFKMIGAIEGRVSPAAATAATALLDMAFGAAREGGAARHWGSHRVRPYRDKSGADPVIGATLGGDAGAAFARLPLDPARPTGNLGGAWVDLAAGGKVLRAWMPALALLGEARELSIAASADPAGLSARIRVSR